MRNIIFCRLNEPILFESVKLYISFCFHSLYTHIFRRSNISSNSEKPIYKCTSFIRGDLFLQRHVSSPGTHFSKMMYASTQSLYRLSIVLSGVKITCETYTPTSQFAHHTVHDHSGRIFNALELPPFVFLSTKCVQRAKSERHGPINKRVHGVLMVVDMGSRRRSRVRGLRGRNAEGTL